MPDASVIAALEAAVAADPANAALRVHLASLVVMAGDPARALEHADAALAHTAEDTEAPRHSATASARWSTTSGSAPSGWRCRRAPTTSRWRR